MLIFVVGGALLIGSVVFGDPHRSAAPEAAPLEQPIDGGADHVVRAEPERDPHRDEEAQAEAQAEAEPTAAGMERFVAGYLATVARDPAAALVAADAVVPQRQRRLRVVLASSGTP